MSTNFNCQAVLEASRCRKWAKPLATNPGDWAAVTRVFVFDKFLYERRAYGNSLYYFCNSSESLKYLKMRCLNWIHKSMTDHLTCFFSKCKSKQQCSITSLWSEGPSSKSLNLINAGEDVEKGNPPTLLVGSVNWCIHYREQYGGSLKILKIELSYDPATLLWGIYPKNPTN